MIARRDGNGPSFTIFSWSRRNSFACRRISLSLLSAGDVSGSDEMFCTDVDSCEGTGESVDITEDFLFRNCDDLVAKADNLIPQNLVFEIGDDFEGAEESVDTIEDFLVGAGESVDVTEDFLVGTGEDLGVT